ncbi:UNVERIFIED_ORG: CDP-diglyceride synthetase [Arthrobacter sp. UYEF1]
MNRRRGILVGLIVGLIASSGVAASSHTPVVAFALSMLCVLIAVGGVWLISGIARR